MFFVNAEYKADLKIYFVNAAYKAKWKNNFKKGHFSRSRYFTG
jgi:hypothetical protein